MPNENIPPCTCGWLERETEEPSSPIRFDPLVNEYQITCSGGGMLCIYHCPFCGGRAPESKRDLLFAHITHEERSRLSELVQPLKTVQDVLTALGEPDFESQSSATTPEADGKPETVELFRHLRYQKLSETADVCATVFADNHVSMALQSKYLGKPE